MSGESLEKALMTVNRFKRALQSVLVFNLVDAVCTSIWVHCGHATEANPVMDAMLSQGIEIFLLTKIVIVTGLIGILWTNKDCRLARIGVCLPVVVYTAIVGMHIGYCTLLAMGVSMEI